MFCTTTDNKVLLYDKSEEKIISEYSGDHTSSEFNASVRISSDNSLVMCTSEDGHLVLYDLVTKKVVERLEAHDKPVVTMDLFNSGKYGDGTDVILVGSLDRTVSVWST